MKWLFSSHLEVSLKLRIKEMKQGTLWGDDVRSLYSPIIMYNSIVHEDKPII